MDRAPLEEAEVVARRVGRIIGSMMPKGWGFTLVIASHGADGFCTYVANLERDGAVKMLRELLVKIERNEENV
jgi:hypothetical protein